MSSIERLYRGSFESALERVQQAALNCGSSVELVDECRYQTGDILVVLRVYEKYFYRNDSAASLSVTVAGKDNDAIRIMAIGSGGGTGLLNFDWGANSSFLKDFEAYL